MNKDVLSQEDHLRSYEKFEKNTNPLFIFGMGRGGTSLTYHVMKFHPQLVKLPSDTYFFRHFWNLRKKIPPKLALRILLGFTVSYSRDSRVLTDNREERVFILKKMVSLIHEGDPAKIFGFLGYIAYARQKESAADVRWWVERTNHHMFYYKTLKSWFPKCKFIFCVRDPRAVITSALGAISTKKGPLSPSFKIKYCQDRSFTWLHKAERALALKKKYGADVLISRYEDFVRDPVSRIANIWEFLGVSEMSSEEIKNKVDNLGLTYISKTGVNRARGIDAASVERWKMLLPEEGQQIIEAITHKAAGDLGYQIKARMPFAGLSYLIKRDQETYPLYLKRMAALNKSLAKNLLYLYTK